ncbi:MAG: N-acetylneuraminate synthase family protein [Bacteroidales bacterium]|nr:N-acetylneuraminate synthase family protein [Bacteroidales bacterium]
MKRIKIGGKEIYNFSHPYIIAEIGSNHNGDMDLARSLINSAKECGADAVKFQSWSPTSLISKEEYDRNQKYNDSPKKHFGSLREMVEKYYLREEQHFELKNYCDTKQIDFCSTPFSASEVDLLDRCKVPFFKVASMDINNFHLLQVIAERNKPIVLSTGMATLGEIDRAVELLQKKGVTDIALLHCISIYPPAYEDIHLNNIVMLQQTFGVPVGFSDHSIGISVPLASVALGACIIEKHFTIDKNLPGWDHEISADPTELSIICKESKNIALSLGSFIRTVSDAEQKKKLKFRRSIVYARDLPKGHILMEDDLTSKRPGTGISPDLINMIIGRSIIAEVKEDTLIRWEQIK